MKKSSFVPHCKSKVETSDHLKKRGDTEKPNE